MESLLRLSGLINEEDGDRTDLGTLERRLVDKTINQSADESAQSTLNPDNQPSITNGSRRTSPQFEKLPTPSSPVLPTEPHKQPEEEVEVLSDMMCSLVTNSCGETKYIGRFHSHSLAS